MLRLERQFGLRGVVLQWFHSYLTDRTFQVVCAGRKSAVVIIPCSVPQGSVLCQRLFILYMADLADVVSAHDVKHHAYANDTQLCLRCRTQEATTAAHRLDVCITDVQRWMEANRLKLNADKTRASVGRVEIWSSSYR